MYCSQIQILFLLLKGKGCKVLYNNNGRARQGLGSYVARRVAFWNLQVVGVGRVVSEQLACFL